MPQFTVEANETPLSPLAFLQRHISSASKSYLRQLLKKGKVKGPRGVVSEQDQLQPGDVLTLPDSGRLSELMAATAQSSQDQQLFILYESREILIVDKPAGLAIHSSEGHQDHNLTGLVDELIRSRGDAYQVAPIHRLDLETSGPVLFGKGKKACSELGKLFMCHEVEKSYLALVAGKTPGRGLIHSEVPSKGKTKEAQTAFQALDRNDQASLLKVTLYTGRQHQIRRQLSELGHPLFGDRRYRGQQPEGLPRLFLHCCQLAFVDPFSGAPVEIDSPLPADLSQFLDTLGLHYPNR
ncbi:RluA family pseudouridine synthase [uncultured Desulfuromonas sp.]|uniref:RluA family pseudouridine synthase n=1 Tax=uncultured Desulfuromonas sp. TaxID=181013 RepID=UPI002AAB6005|nr:RluA family pseudouridine synthase [uncultured Desulfuromonas sp.]